MTNGRIKSTYLIGALGIAATVLLAASRGYLYGYTDRHGWVHEWDWTMAPYRVDTIILDLHRNTSPTNTLNTLVSKYDLKPLDQSPQGYYVIKTKTTSLTALWRLAAQLRSYPDVNVSFDPQVNLNP